MFNNLQSNKSFNLLRLAIKFNKAKPNYLKEEIQFLDNFC